MTEKAENLENLNKQQIKNFLNKEKAFQEKIEILENKLLSSEKFDYILLQKQNKDFEVQINNLNHAYQNMSIKYEEDSKKNQQMTKTLLEYREKLKQELIAIETLRNDIINAKLKKDKEKIKISKPEKIEMKIKYLRPYSHDINISPETVADLSRINSANLIYNPLINQNNLENDLAENKIGK
jgi:hypothetical protein